MGLILVVLLLLVIGIMMVFSSSFYYSMWRWNDKFFFFKRNLIWAAIGFIAMLVTSVIPYRFYRKIAPLLLGFSFLSLVLVLTDLGTVINNSRRWIFIGPISFMPSEFAKLCVILFMAHSLTVKDKLLKNFVHGVLPYLGIAGVYFILIILQPNLSTAITIVMIIVAMMFVAGVRVFHLISVGSLGAGLFFFAAITSPYRWKRVTTFLNPFDDIWGDGWQVVQSLYALGSGGLTGVGLGQSVQNKLYLPEPQNDFIFATIGEELGFIGSTFVILVFIMFIYKGVQIAKHAPDKYGCYLATGIVAMVSIQSLMNIAVATSSMPVTGVSLPFISFGGNALVYLMASVGILLNISKSSRADSHKA
ncbi:MAG: putative lipid II flippase FtsW [Clostridia bacterium]|nr:putative lipid II flippase FtsW [Clostridia bacterium]